MMNFDQAYDAFINGKVNLEEGLNKYNQKFIKISPEGNDKSFFQIVFNKKDNSIDNILFQNNDERSYYASFSEGNLYSENLYERKKIDNRNKIIETKNKYGLSWEKKNKIRKDPKYIEHNYDVMKDDVDIVDMLIENFRSSFNYEDIDPISVQHKKWESPYDVEKNISKNHKHFEAGIQKGDIFYDDNNNIIRQKYSAMGVETTINYDENGDIINTIVQNRRGTFKDISKYDKENDVFLGYSDLTKEEIEKIIKDNNNFEKLYSDASKKRLKYVDENKDNTKYEHNSINNTDDYLGEVDDFFSLGEDNYSMNAREKYNEQIKNASTVITDRDEAKKYTNDLKNSNKKDKIEKATKSKDRILDRKRIVDNRKNEQKNIENKIVNDAEKAYNDHLKQQAETKRIEQEKKKFILQNSEELENGNIKESYYKDSEKAYLDVTKDKDNNIIEAMYQNENRKYIFDSNDPNGTYYKRYYKNRDVDGQWIDEKSNSFDTFDEIHSDLNEIGYKTPEGKRTNSSNNFEEEIIKENLEDIKKDPIITTKQLKDGGMLEEYQLNNGTVKIEYDKDGNIISKKFENKVNNKMNLYEIGLNPDGTIKSESTMNDGILSKTLSYDKNGIDGSIEKDYFDNKIEKEAQKAWEEIGIETDVKGLKKQYFDTHKDVLDKQTKSKPESKKSKPISSKEFIEQTEKNRWKTKDEQDERVKNRKENKNKPKSEQKPNNPEPPPNPDNSNPNPEPESNSKPESEPNNPKPNANVDDEELGFWKRRRKQKKERKKAIEDKRRKIYKNTEEKGRTKTFSLNDDIEKINGVEKKRSLKHDSTKKGIGKKKTQTDSYTYTADGKTYSVNFKDGKILDETYTSKDGTISYTYTEGDLEKGVVRKIDKVADNDQLVLDREFVHEAEEVFNHYDHDLNVEGSIKDFTDTNPTQEDIDEYNDIENDISDRNKEYQDDYDKAKEDYDNAENDWKDDISKEETNLNGIEDDLQNALDEDDWNSVDELSKQKDKSKKKLDELKDESTLKKRKKALKQKKRNKWFDLNNKDSEAGIFKDLKNVRNKINEIMEKMKNPPSPKALEDLKEQLRKLSLREKSLLKLADKLGGLKNFESKTVKEIAKQSGPGAILSLVTGVSTYKDQRREGKSVASAGAHALGDFALSEVLGFKGYLALGAIKAAPDLAVKGSAALFKEMRRMNSASRFSTFGEAEFQDTQQLSTMRQSGMELAKMSQYRLEQTLMGNEAKYLHR